MTGASSYRGAFTFVAGAGMLAGSILLNRGGHVDAAHIQEVLVTNAARTQNVPVTVQNLPARQTVHVDNFPPSVQVTGTVAASQSGDWSVKSADTTVALWEGVICGSASGGSPDIDVSGAEHVTIVLHSIECAGDDAVYLNTMVNNYGASLALLTIPSCGGTITWQSTVPGLTLSLFCSGGSQPSRLAVAAYGRP